MPDDPTRLDDVFAAALAETAPSARAAYLDRACQDDPELRERVDALLAAHDAAGRFLHLPEGQATVNYVPLAERPGSIVGPYKLLQQIGEGGMGVVFMAEQTEPIRRTVALKIIKPGMDTRQVIARFEAERQALALMDHPNIARVLDAGTTGSGRPYFVMELVKGMPITKYCDEHHVTPRERLELFLPVCQAVQHAHQKGIIHRDLKPSNVMIALYDGRPIPKVIDFGVAKATGSKLTDRTMFTEFGAILGTFEYMSPEQAELNQLDVDTRSDIYSLGVLLYELLTGSTPLERKRIKAIALHEVLRVIREEEPPKPSTRLSSSDALPSIAANRGFEPLKLNRLLQGELDWIVMKALEKDRNRRYETANSFAADVQRYLADEAVEACPPSAAYRFRKFARRNKRPMMAASVILLTLIAGIIGTTIGLIRAENARQAEVEQRRLAQASEQRAIAAATAEKIVKDQVAIILFQRAFVEHSAGRIAEGIALLLRSYEFAGLNNDLRKSIRTLIAGWADQGGRPIVQNGAVLAAAFSPDGKTILIGGHDPQCRASFWDAGSLSPIGEPLRHDGSVRAVAFSPDGSLAMTGSENGTAALWDTRTRTPVGKPMQHSSDGKLRPVCAVAFGRGGIVATGGRDNMARLWQAPSGDAFGEPLKQGGLVSSVAFRPDGQAVLTGCYDGTVQLWGLESHERLGVPIQVSKRPQYAARFSPDGSKIVTGSTEGTAQLWESKTGKLIGDLVGHTNEVFSVAFSPDGRRILTGSLDDTAQLWDTTTLKRVGPALRHGGFVMCVDFSPDGRTLITGGADRIVRLWDVSDSDGRILRHQGNILGMSFSSSGKLVTTIGDDRTARVWDAHTAQPLEKPMAHDAPVRSLAISPDGKTLVTGSADRVLRWNAQSGERLGEPWKFNGEVRKVDFSADGTTLLVQFANDTLQTVELRDFSSGVALSKPLEFDADSVLLASSSDKQSIVMGHRQGPMGSTAQIWNFQAGEAPQHSLKHELLITAAAFSRDGRRVVTGGGDQRVRVWDARTGVEEVVYQHAGVVTSVSISGDGGTILSGSEDRTARVWDARTNLALGSSLQHADRVTKVALTPDSRLAITICGDGTAYVWDVFSCKPVTQPMQFEERVDDFEIRTDGLAILFRCADGSARLYDIPRPVPDKPELIHAWALAHSGFQVDDKFEPRQLSQAEWLNAQQEVRALEIFGTATSLR